MAASSLPTHIPVASRRLYITPTNTSTIQAPSSVSIMFYPTDPPKWSTGDDSSFFTKLGEYISDIRMNSVSPRWCHCNFVFGFEEGARQHFTTWSVNKHESTVFLAIHFSGNRWNGFDLGLPVAKRSRLFEWAVNHRVKFNKCGLVWNFMPCVCECCTYDAHGERMFCAEQAMLGLQTIKFPGSESIKARVATPDMVYDLIAHEMKLATPTIPIRSISNWTLPDGPEQYMTLLGADTVLGAHLPGGDGTGSDVISFEIASSFRQDVSRTPLSLSMKMGGPDDTVTSLHQPRSSEVKGHQSALLFN